MSREFIKSVLEADQCKENRDLLVNYIEEDNSRFSHLMYFFLDEKMKFTVDSVSDH